MFIERDLYFHFGVLLRIFFFIVLCMLGTQSHVIKGIGKKGSKEAKGVEMMRALRKATAGALERNKAPAQQLSRLLVSITRDEPTNWGINVENFQLGSNFTKWSQK